MSQVRLDAYIRGKGALAYSQVGRIAIALLRQIEESGRQGLADTLTVVCPRRVQVSGNDVTLVDESLSEEELLPYMSPEAIGRGALDVRSTLYSLGCTLFELLTAQKPYPWENPEEIRQAHLAAPVPDPRGLNAGIPTTLSNFVRGLLAKSPDDRPASAIEALAQIQASVGMAPARQPEPAASSSAPPAARGTQRAAPGRRPAAPGRSRRAPAAGGRGGRGGRGRTQRATAPTHDHDDYGDGDGPRRYVRRKQTPVFTWCGVGLGAFICVLVLMHGLKLKRQLPELERQLAEEKLEQKARSTLTRRKVDNAVVVYNRQEAEAAKQLQQTLTLNVRTTLKKDALDQKLKVYAHLPTGKQMAEEFLKLQYEVTKMQRGLRRRQADGE